MVRRMDFYKAGAVLAACLLLAGCGAPESATQQAAPTAERSLHEEPPWRPAHDIRALMETVVQHHADTFWGSAGWIIDADGERSLRPTTEEGWADVVAAAATVAQAGNLLMTPLYSEGRGEDWFQFSGALVEIGLRAQAAAEARDEERIFETGAVMYRVCESCHMVYPPADLPPGELFSLPPEVDSALNPAGQ